MLAARGEGQSLALEQLRADGQEVDLELVLSNRCHLALTSFKNIGVDVKRSVGGRKAEVGVKNVRGDARPGGGTGLGINEVISVVSANQRSLASNDLTKKLSLPSMARS